MRLFIPIVLLSVSVCFADSPAVYRDRIRAYVFSKGVDADGEMSSGRLVLGSRGGRDLYVASWDVPGVPRPLDGELPSYGDSVAILEGVAESKELARQAAKPAGQKAKENDFYEFIRLVLAAAGDPRADDAPTPKLGFEELTPMIEGIQGVDPVAAVNLTLKGLSIDSALKRYSALWWDDAVEHELD